MLKIHERILNSLSIPYVHFISDIVKRTGYKTGVVQEEIKKLIELNLIHNDNEKYYLKKEGTVIIKSQGFGFITVNGEDSDYFLSEKDVNGLFSGDSVSFYVLPKSGKQRLDNAKIIKVLDRSNKNIYGKLIYKKSKKGIEYNIISYNKEFKAKAIVHEKDLNNAVEGNYVVGEILEYNGNKTTARVTKIVGHKDDPGIDISLIALTYGFDLDIKKEVIDSLNNIPDSINKNDYKNRVDFTDSIVFTIDGDDSKDFDDAISLKKLSNGNYKLYVHIADVSEYVKQDSILDNEALKKGTSVYLADRVIPMLPHKLSNGICSLNEGEDRLVLSCIMEINNKGDIISHDIVEGIINSRYRLTYNNVNKIFDNDNVLIEKYKDIYQMLIDMLELSKIIRKKRENNGSLDFDVPEYKIKLDENGEPISFELRQRGKSELLIEDFMLCANQTVAYYLNSLNLPCCYRVHENPDQEKLLNVFNFIKNMGHNVISKKNEIAPKMIQQTINNIKDSNDYYIVNQMLLRAMMKAKYKEECLGHYGLAFKYYCHFTSPIRRYPDLFVHRIIKELVIHPEDFVNKLNKYNSIISYVCEESSKLERKSIECEREVNDMLMAIYMQRHIGERFNAIINSITSFGMFVSLDNGIEGLIHISNMNGFYNFNEKYMTLSNSRICYNIGDRVRVVCVSTSKKDRSVDFMLESDYRGL